MRRFAIPVISMFISLLAMPVASALAQGGPIQIEIGQTVSGQLTESTPEILYTFQGTAGVAVDITMIYDMDSDPENYLDTYLILRGPDGSVLAENDDAIGATDSAIMNFTLPATGTYTIVATSFTAAHGYGADDGYFLLSLYEATPRQTLSMGQSITVEMHGGADVIVDLDLEAGTLYRLSATVLGDSLLDPYLRVLDQDGSIVAEDDDSGEGLSPLIDPLVVSRDGIYEARISRFASSSESDGEIEISLQASEATIMQPGREYSVESTISMETFRFLFQGAEMDWEVNISTDKPLRYTLSILAIPSPEAVEAAEAEGESLEVEEIFEATIMYSWQTNLLLHLPVDGFYLVRIDAGGWEWEWMDGRGCTITVSNRPVVVEEY